MEFLDKSLELQTADSPLLCCVDHAKELPFIACRCDFFLMEPAFQVLLEVQQASSVAPAIGATPLCLGAAVHPTLVPHECLLHRYAVLTPDHISI